MAPSNTFSVSWKSINSFNISEVCLNIAPSAQHHCRTKPKPNQGSCECPPAERHIVIRRISKQNSKRAVFDSQTRAGHDGFAPEADDFAEFLQPRQHAVFERV